VKAATWVSAVATAGALVIAIVALVLGIQNNQAQDRETDESQDLVSDSNANQRKVIQGLRDQLEALDEQQDQLHRQLKTALRQQRALDELVAAVNVVPRLDTPAEPPDALVDVDGLRKSANGVHYDPAQRKLWLPAYNRGQGEAELVQLSVGDDCEAAGRSRVLSVFDRFPLPQQQTSQLVFDDLSDTRLADRSRPVMLYLRYSDTVASAARADRRRLSWYTCFELEPGRPDDFFRHLRLERAGREQG
jgi:hypothetical protein